MAPYQMGLIPKQPLSQTTPVQNGLKPKRPKIKMRGCPGHGPKAKTAPA